MTIDSLYSDAVTGSAELGYAVEVGVCHHFRVVRKPVHTIVGWNSTGPA
jgi:hypothetical protein